MSLPLAYHPLGKKEKKEKTSKVLMILVAAMYINQTAIVSTDWYTSWLAYIQDGGSIDQTLAVLLEEENTPLTVLWLIAVSYLLITIRVGIADSIMVLASRISLF
jgi:hypothetical protein